MPWLAPAMAFAALCSAVLALTFLYVWSGYIRQRYVLCWSLAWLAAIPHQIFTWRLLADPTGHANWALGQLFLVLSALLMVGGCHDFVHRRFPTGRVVALSLPFAAWILLAPRLTDDFARMTMPTTLLIAVSYLWAARCFHRLQRERPTRGATLVALLFALASAHELDYPLLGNLPWAAPVGYALAAMLTFSISLCLLIMILEQSRADADSERARLRAIVDNLPVGVVVTTSSGELLLANGIARSLAGTLGDHMIDFEARALRLADGSQCPPEELPIRRALRTGEPTPAREFVLRGDAGAVRTLLVNAAPVVDEKGNGQGVVAVFHDIDELKRMQAEVSRSQRLKGLGTLAAGVAHDFNNALTMIMGHAELALDASQDPVVRQQINIITRVASDSAAIVRRIQDVARTRASRDQVSFDLSAIVREVVDISRPRWRDQAQAQGVIYDVRTSLEHDVPVLGQPAELREAVLNIVLNALDAMPTGGTLTLAVSRAGGDALLTLSDSGVGMSAEVRERIFDPFFTTKGAKGTGLGLALVFGIVQRHDGQVTVASEPGVGTTFSLRFPIVRATLPVAPPVPAGLATQPLRLLVVDDEPLVRHFMETMLRRAGHDVVAAEGGADALCLVAQREFDVVFTDLGMPGMTGWEVTEGVHRLRPGIQVVLVTGWGDALSPEETRQRGVARVLPKPFTRDQILGCLEEVMREGVTRTAVAV